MAQREPVLPYLEKLPPAAVARSSKVELLEGVAGVLPPFAKDFRLLLITKGDLRARNGRWPIWVLRPYFCVVEILSDKDSATILRVEELGMVGNSLKSDVLPMLACKCLIILPLTACKRVKSAGQLASVCAQIECLAHPLAIVRELL